MSRGTRIPLAEAAAHCRIIEDLIKEYSEHMGTPALEYLVVGSIRRKCETCGDGDIVIWEKDREVLTKIMSSAKENNIVAKMETMPCGNIISITMPAGYKIEFYFAEENGWWHKVQFITGSRDYNEVLMTKINAKGKWLSRTGFFDELGQRIIVNSEKELFEAYGEEYVSPENRSLIL
jgi:DNA polymerase/3'-5' exonuclease PolX